MLNSTRAELVGEVFRKTEVIYCNTSKTNLFFDTICKTYGIYRRWDTMFI